jgi:hypothetical protein
MPGVTLNRIPPRLGPEVYQTYAIKAPLRTHWRPANCEEYECDEFLYGFVLTVDEATELGQQQAYYVRHDKTRRMHEQRVEAFVTKFIYGPGNKCFNFGEHRVPIGRPPRLLVSDGDWRWDGMPNRRIRVHSRAEDWVEDFATNQLGLAAKVQEGSYDG